VRLTPTARALIERFWPGPLTLLVEKGALISDLVTSGHPTVALRCPAHPVAQALLRAFDGPLVAPSANPFGRISPTSAQAVQEGLGERLEVILDGGACEVGLESTIVDATQPHPSLPILRLGGVAPESLEALGFELSYPTPIIGQAPGTLKNHYAPRKPLYLFDGELPAEGLPAEAGYLTWRDHLSAPQLNAPQLNVKQPHLAHLEVLSPSGSSVEGATRLFELMRALDASPAPWLVAELPPPEGLGAAIRDRLKRAASGFFDPSAPPHQA
jgi:L-threonylcarbamoyladenylate synthase